MRTQKLPITWPKERVGRATDLPPTPRKALLRNIVEVGGSFPARATALRCVLDMRR